MSHMREFLASQCGGELWDAARNLNIPVLLLEATGDHKGLTFVPSFSVFNNSQKMAGSNLLVRPLIDAPEM